MIDQTKGAYLNFGCSDAPVEGCINIDIFKNINVDEVVDLSIFPYKWKDNSIDGIYMIHLLEHFSLDISIKVIKECHRILKKGGFLHIQVPHPTYVRTLGQIDHYKTYSRGALTELLTQKNIFISSSLFETIVPEEIHWIRLQRNKRNKYVKFKYNMNFTKYTYLQPLIISIGKIVDFLISLKPEFFERFWWIYVGGAEEIVWRGRKI